MAITKQQFNTLEDLFDYYNGALFNNELPACLVNLSRHKGAHGFFAPERWQDRKRKIVHEISLNPDTMSRTDREWHSTFVHEMVHLWEKVNGTQSRQCYHNRIWAEKMEAIGLMPSNTGKPGGKKTGQLITHYIIKGGAFDAAFKKIRQQSLANLKLPYTPNPSLFGRARNKGAYPTSLSGVKVKYTCACNNRVWGKSGLRIRCIDCQKQFMPVQFQ